MAEKVSDLIYEMCCGFCEDYTIKREATFYCKQCSEGFCHECVKYHNILFKTHSTYGREDKKKWSVAKAKLEALMLCEQHPDHRIELFCEDHSKLCCHLCHSHNHRQCSKINLIDVKAKAMHQKGDLRKCSATIELEQITIEHEIDVINKRLQRLRTTREKAHADIKLARYQLNDILDTLERNSVQSLNTVYETLQKSLHSHLSICLKAKDDLQLIKHSIKDIDDEKYLLSFVSIAKSMELVSKAQVMLKEMPEQKHSVVEFRSNKAIEQMLICLSGLGDAIEMKQEGTAGEILKCNNKTMYDVHITRYVNYCDISGICELSSGYMLISDYSNCRVKLLDIEFKVISYFNLPAIPWDMCSVSPNEVAVIVDTIKDTIKKHSVQFLSVNKRKIRKGNTLVLQHTCHGIAHFDGDLFITSCTALYQYKLNGELVKKIYEDTSDEFTVYKCSVFPDGSRLYVTDLSHNKLLTLSIDGTVLSSFEDPALQGPTGVHVSETGMLLVCGWSLNVIQVDGEGGVVTLASKEDGLKNPQSVYYSASSRRLLVGHKSDEILVIGTE